MSKLPNFQLDWLCYKSTFQTCCKAQNRIRVWGLGLLRNHKLHLDVAQLVLLWCKFLWHWYLAKAREDMSLAPSYKLNAMMAITKDPPKYFSSSIACHLSPHTPSSHVATIGLLLLLQLPLLPPPFFTFPTHNFFSQKHFPWDPFSLAKHKKKGQKHKEKKEKEEEKQTLEEK